MAETSGGTVENREEEEETVKQETLWILVSVETKATVKTAILAAISAVIWTDFAEETAAAQDAAAAAAAAVMRAAANWLLRRRRPSVNLRPR